MKIYISKSGPKSGPRLYIKTQSGQTHPATQAVMVVSSVRSNVTWHTPAVRRGPQGKENLNG